MTEKKQALLVFSKPPLPGMVKTRMTKEHGGFLTVQQAADLYTCCFFDVRLQLAAVLLCAFGVTFFTVNYGEFPWIAVCLALTFGLYGAVKKRGGYPATPALAFESTVMVVPAIVFAIVLANVTGQHAFAANLDDLHGWYLTALLVIGGPVTALPLVLFAKAANSIPLSLLGFIQYVSPTIALIVGGVRARRAVHAGTRRVPGQHLVRACPGKLRGPAPLVLT